MLRLALLFLVIALVAALFGFTGISAAAVNVAQFLFWVFVVLFAVTTVIALITGRQPPEPLP